MAALISYRNLADAAAVTGPALSGFPLANLKTRQLSTRWRAAIDSELVVDLGQASMVRLVALLSHNAPVGAITQLFKSANGVDWEFAGVSISDDTGVPGLPQNVMLAMPDGIDTRWLKIKTPAGGGGYFEAGRLWIGDALVIPYGADSDWTNSTIERGSVDVSAGGEVYPSAKPRIRELRMSFTTLDESLAFGTSEATTSVTDVPSFQDLHTFVGAIGEVIAMPRTDWIWPRRVGLYGRLSDDSLSIRHDTGPNYATSVRVIEER